ncbi:hypothetical protein ACVTNF_000358 [Photobacterium damselae]
MARLYCFVVSYPSVEQDDNFLLKADFTFSYQDFPDLQLALR